jgi:hypothetical protein
MLRKMLPLALAALAGCATTSAPRDGVVPSEAVLLAAVERDLQSDAMWSGDTWFWPNQHRPAYQPGFALSATSCRTSSASAACRFLLTRRKVDLGQDGQVRDDRIVSRCSATFVPDEADGWRVRRLGPRVGGSGHSTSTMRCREVERSPTAQSR